MQFAQAPSRQELLRSMSRGFQKTESSSTWWGLFWLLLGIAVFALILFGISTWQSRDRRAAPNHPGRLFSDLSKQLGLNRVDQHILKSIATQNDLSSAAELYMSPGIFDGAVRQWHHTGPGSGEIEKAMVVRLRHRIFGSAAPSAEGSAAESPASE
jgi:hypothetical protein